MWYFRGKEKQLVSNSAEVNGFNMKKKNFLAIESDKVIYYPILKNSNTLFLCMRLSHFDLKMFDIRQQNVLSK